MPPFVSGRVLKHNPPCISQILLLSVKNFLPPKRGFSLGNQKGSKWSSYTSKDYFLHSLQLEIQKLLKQNDFLEKNIIVSFYDLFWLNLALFRFWMCLKQFGLSFLCLPRCVDRFLPNLLENGRRARRFRRRKWNKWKRQKVAQSNLS